MGKLAKNGKQELIDEIGLTQRRVDQLIERGVLVDGSDGAFDLELNLRRYRAYKNNDLEYVEREFQEAASTLKDGFARLRAEPDVKKRRKIEQRERICANVGRLDRALLLLQAMAPDGHRGLLSYVTNNVIGDAIAQSSELLGMQIDDRPADKPKTQKRSAA